MSDRTVTIQIVRAPSAGDRGQTGIRLIVDGEVVDTGDYGGEPEDNCEYRDYKWVKAMLVLLARKLGATATIESVEVDGPTPQAAAMAYYAAMAAPAGQAGAAPMLQSVPLDPALCRQLIDGLRDDAANFPRTSLRARYTAIADQLEAALAAATSLGTALGTARNPGDEAARTGSSSDRNDSCAKGDSNPHGVTH